MLTHLLILDKNKLNELIQNLPQNHVSMEMLLYLLRCYKYIHENRKDAI